MIILASNLCKNINLAAGAACREAPTKNVLSVRFWQQIFCGGILSQVLCKVMLSNVKQRYVENIMFFEKS